MKIIQHHPLLAAAIACVLFVAGCSSPDTAEVVQPPPPQDGTRMTRLFWQDRADDGLKCGDVYRTDDGWHLTKMEVAGFPALDIDKQDLVQMRQIEGALIVGVRDNDKGKLGSGWVAIDCGVDEEPHGDHSHWHYDRPPEVLTQQIDDAQGNPAHVYKYDGEVYLANDARNGFTRISRQSLDTKSPGAFYTGGGNHITMAVVDNKVCYSTWIDGGGPNKGRVDVVDLSKTGEASQAYSFHLSSGVIHGATANSGRIFLAPASGVDWLQADVDLKLSGRDVEVQHIELGKDEETGKPLRTGAFVNHRNWVMFTTGAADAAALCLLNASQDTPELIKLPIDVADGLSLVTPKVVKTSAGKRYAFLFLDRKTGESEEHLTIVDLDPDSDRDFSDASIASTLTVGRSQVEGHFGHHDICFDPAGEYAFITNPGDGDIWVLSLTTLKIEQKLPAGGTPTAILSTGAAE